MTDILICCNCDKEVLWDRKTELDPNGIFYCSDECKKTLCI